MTRMKHCATCYYWTVEPLDQDVGTCNSDFVYFNTIDPAVGGIAIDGEFFTHSCFGCVNHKPKEEV